ncbi:ribonuclease Oy [Epargyreus clarus]|uniref:ribonuclease Oy n=1 Tax=Epargyreus clarus TaxID=520877 RepID=UPI003C2FADB2
MICKLIFATIAVYLCFIPHNVEAKRVSNHEWDILIFTQQWPVTVCKELEKHHTKKCNMPTKRDSWSIHGIWPTKLGTIGPGFCNRTWLFDPEQVRPIEQELIQVWTNIDADSQLYTLWAHEWSKHGTCAAVLDSLNSELKYFSKGLDWLTKYSMTDILEESNIVPSNTQGYRVLDIHNAIKNKLGVNPAIECGNEGGINMIDEIRICFDKNLVLHNCDGIRASKIIGHQVVATNCDVSKDVLYPEYGYKSSLYVQLYKLVSFIKWLTL